MPISPSSRSASASSPRCRRCCSSRRCASCSPSCGPDTAALTSASSLPTASAAAAAASAVSLAASSASAGGRPAAAAAMRRQRRYSRAAPAAHATNDVDDDGDVAAARASVITEAARGGLMAPGRRPRFRPRTPGGTNYNPQGITARCVGLGHPARGGERRDIRRGGGVRARQQREVLARGCCPATLMQSAGAGVLSESDVHALHSVVQARVENYHVHGRRVCV